MSPEDELMGLVFLGFYLVLAPAYTAVCAVPLGVIYGLVAGLRSRRNAVILITIPALLAALVVTVLVCGVPLRSFAADEGLPWTQLAPVVVPALITFTVALVVWILPIGAAVSVSRVFATRGLRPTVVTLVAALLLAALVLVAFWAMFLLAGTSPFSPPDDPVAQVSPGILLFGPALTLSCIFLGPIVRFVTRNQPRPKEPEGQLPLDPLTESDTAPARLSTTQRRVIASLACAIVVVVGCILIYSLMFRTDRPRPVPPSPHPLPPTWTCTRIPQTPTPLETAVGLTPQAPTPTNTLVVPLTPTATSRPCPPAPTADMAPELLELLDSVQTDEERLMVQFLMGQYNPSLGLLEESPNIGAGHFFVHAGAYLAGLDTSWYDECYDLEPSPHWRVLRERVPLPEDEIEWGVKLLDLFDGVHSYQPDPSIVMSMDLWADRLLLSALSAKLAGNHAREQELVAQARDMWDGECLRDEFYRWHEQEYGYPACETFKTALYYLLTGDADALAILRKMQETNRASPNYGGIYNMYDLNGDRFPADQIDANSETTAVVLLCYQTCGAPPRVDLPQELVERRDSAVTDAERLMVEFLMSMYSPELGLLRESPNVGADHHWVHSDAYLAGLDTSWYDRCYGLRPNPHWSVLRGEEVPEEVFSYGVEERVLDPARGVFSVVPTKDGVMPDWEEYADRVLLAALNARQAGDHTREEELTNLAHAMWDRHCLRDVLYHEYLDEDGRVTCETYKTALYYHLTGDPAAFDIVLGLQERDPDSVNLGGIYTHYGEDGQPFPWTDANSETTAVVLLTIGG